MRPTLLRRQGPPAREALQALLVDRVDCTPVLVAGSRGYAFAGNGTFGGLRRPARGPLPLVAPRGHEPFCTLEFRGVVRAA